MSSFCEDDLSTGVLLFKYCNLIDAGLINGDTNAESILPWPVPLLSVRASPSRKGLNPVSSVWW